MSKKNLLRIALSALGVMVLLFGVLVVHIFMVTGNEPSVNSNLYLSRIDFEKPLTEEESVEVKSIVSALPGIHKAYVNKEAGTLVYGYYKGKQNPDVVYAKLGESTPLAIKKFEVSEEDLAAGCPAFDENSATFKVGAFVQNLIH